MDFRKDLERLALENVCTCFYYDLADSIGGFTDDDLHNIIKDGAWCHYEQIIKQPCDGDLEMLQECELLNDRSIA